MKYIAIFVFSLAFAQNIPSPREIQKELEESQGKFNRAKQMFNPWYTGPLITPSATVIPPGQGNIQPYLVFEGAYGSFDSNRKSISLKENKYTLELTPVLQFGITDTVDFSIVESGIANFQNGKSGGGYSDTTATLGFLITKETHYVPGMKFTVAQTFPTGKYNHLSLNGLGLNSTGSGAYQTEFGLAAGKLFRWLYEHPVNLRYFLGYTLSTTVDVEGFNTYGGDESTVGKVRPGNAFRTDLGIEYSIAQNFVFALDVAYVATDRTRFHGKTKLPVDGGYSDNLSLAPALEYLWTPGLGVIFGSQFSVYGRNSANFANGQVSLTYSW